MTTNTATLIRTQKRTRTLTPNWDGLRPVAIVGSVALWILALRDADVARMNDYGLISILSVSDFVALAILTGSFCISLSDRPLKPALLFLHVAALIFMLFGAASLIQDVPRFESTWKHVGITDYIIRNQSVDPRIDAYFNWPVFFIFLAFVTEITGLTSAMSLATWTPVVSELFYLGPLLLIFRRATADARLIWLAIWTFYLANWVGQDYLSPQGFNYFLYLVIIAILVTWFETATAALHPVFRLVRGLRIPADRLERAYRWIAPADMPIAPSTHRQRIALVGIILGVYAVIVSSHQLTPFALIGAVTALVVLNRCGLRGLPIVMGIMALLWVRYMAEAYFAGHGEKVAGQVGAVGESVGANMTDRLSGSTGHIHVVYLRTAVTLALWLLALFGGLRRLFAGHRDLTFAVLAAAPFPLIGLQSYGGEMLLRVYLLSLPFMAFFAAAIFFPGERATQPWRSTVVLALVCLVATTSFFVTRYGNERMDYFTPAEVAAVEYVYDVAPPGSMLLGGTVKTPWKNQNYEKYRYRTLSDDAEWGETNGGTPDLSPILALMKDSKNPAAFLIFTRSQFANDELFGLLPYGLTTIAGAVAESPEFRLIYANDDATIYVLA